MPEQPHPHEPVDKVERIMGHRFVWLGTAIAVVIVVTIGLILAVIAFNAANQRLSEITSSDPLPFTT